MLGTDGNTDTSVATSASDVAIMVSAAVTLSEESGTDEGFSNLCIIGPPMIIAQAATIITSAPINAIIIPVLIFGFTEPEDVAGFILSLT